MLLLVFAGSRLYKWKLSARSPVKLIIAGVIFHGWLFGSFFKQSAMWVQVKSGHCLCYGSVCCIVIRKYSKSVRHVYHVHPAVKRFQNIHAADKVTELWEQMKVELRKKKSLMLIYRQQRHFAKGESWQFNTLNLLSALSLRSHLYWW